MSTTTPPHVIALHNALFTAIHEHQKGVKVHELVQVLASLASYTVMACAGPAGIDAMELLFQQAVAAARREYQ